MDMLFFLLCGAALLGMLLGLIHPPLVFGRVQGTTRKQVLRWYGTATLACLIGFMVALPPVPQPVQTQAEQATPTPAKPEPAEPAKQPEPQPEAQAAPSAPVAEAPAKQPEPVASPAAPAPAVDVAKQAEEQAAKEKVRQAEEAKKQAEVKATVRRVMNDLMAMDKAASDPSVAARNMLKSVGKTASLGDVYGAMKRAKAAADDGFSRFMDYSVPNDLPQDVRDKLGAALRAFRQGAMVRGDIAKAFMKWLDTPKPSLANEIKEQSNQVTMDMLAAVGSILEAMKAAGYTDAEATAALGDVSGQQAVAGKTKAKRKKP